MQRISFEEGLTLFENAPLSMLQEKAQDVRNIKNPKKRVTFVLDTNPNYTNVCDACCTFCAFYRNKNATDAYTKSVEEVMEDVAFASNQGLTTVLLQGGLNADLPLEYYVSLVKETKRLFPNINPHFFTACEIDCIAKVENMTTKDVLQALFDAGQRSIPGGGAEILSESVRKRISPKKMYENAWIQIHKEAHEVGFKTTATMMYGHVETPEDILIHLDQIRSLQDETQGFTAFIPWSYKSGNNPLKKHVKHCAGPEDYFRILSFARIYLDNFDHIQASWFPEGKEAGMLALNYGADDFGGTILQESVHRKANFVNKTTQMEIIEMIKQAGFEPFERDTFYNILVPCDKFHL
ncbi:MAG: Cyclic dehypoxanthine futalosine synthase [Chlamydiae bacterium]|nr:Cyclic dehypoxanthine futalosine synthase [Chlamydiota bacterium]